MRLWTIQTEEAWTRAKRQGVLVGDGRRVTPEWRPAYRWMAGAMQRRLPTYTDQDKAAEIAEAAERVSGNEPHEVGYSGYALSAVSGHDRSWWQWIMASVSLALASSLNRSRALQQGLSDSAT
jgi:hypothetical protein